MTNLFFTALWSAIPSFLVASTAALAHIGWGCVFFKMFSALSFEQKNLTRTENLLLIGSAYFVAGSTLFGVVGQSLAIYGYFSPQFNLTTILVGVCLFIAFLFKSKLNLFKRHRIDFIQSELLQSKMAWLVGFVILIFIFNCLLFSFLTLHPPGTDAISYYLTQAKMIGSNHSLSLVPTYESFGQNGLGAEVILAQFFSLEQSLAAKVFFIFVAGSCLALIYVITRILGAKKIAALTTCMMLITSSAFTYVIWDGKTDLFALNIALLCTLFLVRVVLDSTNSSATQTLLGLLGFFMALAVQFKLSYLVVLGPLVAVYLISLWFSTHPRMTLPQVVRYLFPLFLFFVLGFGFNIFKNWVLFHEPLAPFLILNTAHQSFDLNQVWYNSENTRWIFMTYPFALVFGLYPMQHGQISVLWLMFLPVAFWQAFRPTAFKNAKRLWAAALISLLIWAALRPSVFAPRYFLISLVASFPFIALALEEWVSSLKSSLSLYKTALIVFMLTFGAIGWKNLEKFFKHSKQAALYANQGDGGFQDEIWRTLNLANKYHRPGDKIALLMYYRYPLTPQALRCVSTLTDLRKIADGADRNQFWMGLYNEGFRILAVDHLTLNAMFLQLLKPETANPFEEKPPDDLQIERHQIDDRFELYTIQSRSRPLEKPTSDCSALQR